MRSQSEETSGGGQPEAERTVRDGTIVRPTFSPAPRQADTVPDDDRTPDDETVPDDVGAPAGAVAESATPAEDYPDGVTAEDYPDGVTAEDYPDGMTAEAAPADDTPTAQETPAAGRAEPVTAAPAAVGAPAAPVAPAALADLDRPLLREDAEVLARWQRVQLGFIDDPQAAVAGAADLVEQAGRALVEALEQRQRQMRNLWDHGPTAAGSAKADTEQLRQMMQRYQALFSQLCQPA